jgi:hypothetical protein
MDPAPKPAVSMWLWIVLIVVAVLGAGFFSWYYLMGPGKKTVASTSTTPTATPSATTATSGWLTYTNSAYGYSIQYPPTLSYTEQDGTKVVFFQTAEEKATSTACA